mmetsp:Transcript_3900/g.9461  ORF Transcript_3900/g.9461 Transcript_3900/m.9461 type:complete len:321 (-) Transcript_3900:487-1449(-)
MDSPATRATAAVSGQSTSPSLTTTIFAHAGTGEAPSPAGTATRPMRKAWRAPHCSTRGRNSSVASPRAPATSSASTPRTRGAQCITDAEGPRGCSCCWPCGADVAPTFGSVVASALSSAIMSHSSSVAACSEGTRSSSSMAGPSPARAWAVARRTRPLECRSKAARQALRASGPSSSRRASAVSISTSVIASMSSSSSTSERLRLMEDAGPCSDSCAAASSSGSCSWLLAAATAAASTASKAFKAVPETGTLQVLGPTSSKRRLAVSGSASERALQVSQRSKSAKSRHLNLFPLIGNTPHPSHSMPWCTRSCPPPPQHGP